jgi:Mo-dependent nitrogenase C-terminus
MSTYFLQSIRQWIDQLPIDNQWLASQVCAIIPAQCPFERDLTILGHSLIHIPPLCKLNPLYQELVTLRFRALCYLANEAEPKLN